VKCTGVGCGLLGLSKYDYNMISVVIYCNHIVLSNLAIIGIGSVFIVYHIQFIFIINHINQTVLQITNVIKIIQFLAKTILKVSEIS
jgi:hypothetical protein